MKNCSKGPIRCHNRRLLVLLPLVALSGAAFGQPTAEAQRIGTYDSRAVAIAYTGSRYFRQQMDELKALRQQALQSGDTREAARLEAQGKAWQVNLHAQGFGIASVDELLVHIGPQLPRIQQEAGVTRLVCKWNALELARHPQAERLDLTMALVDAFEPSARQRQYAIEIQHKAATATP